MKFFQSSVERKETATVNLFLSSFESEITSELWFFFHIQFYFYNKISAHKNGFNELFGGDFSGGDVFNGHNT